MGKYILVWHEEQKQLEKMVNVRIEQGYICQGGVCIQMYQGNLFIIQAMILKNNQSD